MQLTRLSFIGLLALSLAACSASVNPDDDSSSSASSKQAASSEDMVRETRGVSYQGTVQKAGMSIYMQGTHRLELSDGRFVLLESDDLDLDMYVGKTVAVLGAARPTVEGDSSILRVEQITLLQQEESSSSASSIESSSSEASGDMSVSSKAASSVNTSSSKAAISSETVSSAPAASSIASMPAMAADDDIAARAAIMAKASMADSLWTQKYCSTHIGFCFPVHKNWWFKSFGTTTSYLWHVEISTEDIAELGQGPLVVNLMAGSLASTGSADGDVKTQGDFVVGYKAFNDTSHFEASAPKSLEAAVRYIVNHIQAQ
jgi:hypothetical protein